MRLGIFAALFLLSLGLSSLFVTIAVHSSSIEIQVAVMNLLNLPLLFAGNVLFPIAFMPEWLQVAAKANSVA